LLNCQINLSPFLRNNVGTKVIAKSTKAIIAMPHILIFFILPLVKFRFIWLQKYKFSTAFPSKAVSNLLFFSKINLVDSINVSGRNGVRAQWGQAPLRPQRAWLHGNTATVTV
jgi:hypothetical protein